MADTLAIVSGGGPQIAAPAVAGTSSQVASNDGSGNLIWREIAFDRSAIAMIGDSRLAQTYVDVPDETTGQGLVKGQYGFVNVANQLLGQRMRIAGIWAVSGLRSDQYTASQYLDLAKATNAYWLMIGGGIVNDVPIGTTTDFFTDYVKPAALSWLAQGRGVILMTDTGNTSLTSAAQMACFIKYNRQVRQFCAENTHCVCVDIHSVVLDPTSNMAWRSGYTTDGTHIQAIPGAMAAGTLFASLMTPLIPATQPLVNTIGETYSNGKIQWFTNPLWTTVSGGTAITSVTGTIPAGITGGVMATGHSATISTTSGSYGNDLVLALTASQSGTSRINIDLTTNISQVASGDAFKTNCEYTIAAGSSNFAGMCLHLESNVSSSITQARDGYATTSNGVFAATEQTLTLETPEQTIAAGSPIWLTVRLYFTFAGAGSATVNIRRLGVWRRQAS